MATLVSPIEQGFFSKLNARIALTFAKVKKRRKDLDAKEKAMAAQIKAIISGDKFTTLKKTPDGANGTIETYSYQAPDSPFALVMTRYLKKESVDYKAECERLYREVYKDSWKKKWKKFTEDVDMNPIESLDVDVNPSYRIPKV